MPFLNTIKFNCTFSSELLQNRKAEFILPKLFKNLRSLKFIDLAFNFKDKNDLVKFFMNGKFKNTLLELPNLSQIEMTSP